MIYLLTFVWGLSLLTYSTWWFEIQISIIRLLATMKILLLWINKNSWHAQPIFIIISLLTGCLQFHFLTRLPFLGRISKHWRHQLRKGNWLIIDGYFTHTYYINWRFFLLGWAEATSLHIAILIHHFLIKLRNGWTLRRILSWFCRVLT